MSISGLTHPTFIDLLKLSAPDGSVLHVAEILNGIHEGILEYMPFIEGNLLTGHRSAVRTSLPSVSYGRINVGIEASKGDTMQITDTCAEYESIAEIDAKLLERSSNPGLMRFTEDRAHIVRIHTRFFMDLFYGNEAHNPFAFTGFSPRYASATGTTGPNIIDGADGGIVSGSDIYSIWLVNWSPLTITGIVPKNTTPQLHVEDLGVRWYDGDGVNSNARIRMYSTVFRMHAGLHVLDWRHAVRICNLKLSNISDDGSFGPYLPRLMNEAIERIPMDLDGNPAFYMNRALAQKLRSQLASGMDSSTLSEGNVGGISPRKRLVFKGYAPVFRTDALVPRVGNSLVGAETGETPIVF